jgi:hypothetical protein
LNGFALLVSRSLLCGAVAFALPTLAHADALQQQVLAAAKSVKEGDFAFTQTNRFERTGTPVKQFVQRYDPRKGAAAWTLLRVDDRAPTAKEAADSVKRSTKARVASYSRITEWFGAPATRVATTPTSVTYRFASLPKGAVKMGSYDASANTSVEAVVNTAGKIPFVERARFTSNTPFRMFVVAKVERFVFTSTNRLLPDGRPVPELTTSEFSGSFMGSAQTMKTRTTYSDVQAVR